MVLEEVPKYFLPEIRCRIEEALPLGRLTSSRRKGVRPGVNPGRVHAIFLGADGEVLPAAVPVNDGKYPALSPARPSATSFERMIRELWQIRRAWRAGLSLPAGSPNSSQPSSSKKRRAA